MTARRKRWLTAAGWVLGLALALTLLLEPVDLLAGRHGPDGRNYLSLLHSLLFDQDLLLYNDHAMFGLRTIVTPTGYALELHNVGTALAFLPFYALGHLTCLLVGGACNGSNLPTFVWLSLGNWAYGLIALILMFRLARTVLSRGWAVAAVGALALGSSFFYYCSRFFNPHMPAVMLIALLLLVWDRSRDQRAPHLWLLMGVLVGLATTVASYHIVFLLLPGWDVLRALVRRGSRPIRGGPFISGALLGLGAMVGFAPQLVAWRLLFGNFLGTPYGRQLFWFQPGLPDILVSSYHGLYVYAPLLILATAGFVPFLRLDLRRSLPVAATFAAHIYVSSCNIAWWGGASFGARYLVSSLPLLVLPLAQLLSGSRRHPLYVFVIGISVLWTYGLLLADVSGLVDPGQYIPPAWLIRVQGGVLRDLPGLMMRHLFAPRFDAAFVYAIPLALVLATLAFAARKIPDTPRPLGTALALGIPVAVAVLLAVSDLPSQRAIASLDSTEIAGYPRSTYDLYDLSEGYWQRGAYRFVKGDLDRARDDFEWARQIRPDRGWVRFHVAGRRHIPNPMEVPAGDQLTLIGWEAEPGSVTLYWLTGAQVLEPSYRTVVWLNDSAGNEIATYDLGEPDDWRALANEIVRVTYPIGWSLGSDAADLHVRVYPASAPDPLAHIRFRLDAP